MPLSNTLLELLLIAIGRSKRLSQQLSEEEWVSLYEFATRQCVNGIIIDGIEILPEEQRPPKELLLQWIGEVLQSYEHRHELYRKAIAELAGWYNAHGYKMMVLKGYACSLDWPKPEHRPCGDIDIWLFGHQKEADAELEACFKKKDSSSTIDASHHHHTVFKWRGFSVENHFDFVNVYAHKSSAGLEKIFKELGADDSHWIEVNSEKVILPSSNLHALFLMRHLAAHFAGAEINLRQVLDWAFFVDKHTKEIDWGWLVELLDKYHMKDFFNCINAICVDDLGFPVSMFSQVQFDPKLKDRVLYDILSPEFLGLEPKGLLKRVAFKYRRWKRNAWKQELCYGESRWEAFWYGIWAKILKPASI